MSAFILKLIAMITMLIDHAGFQLMDNNYWMRTVGRLAFMIYAFLIAEGYYHLRGDPERLKKHIGKLVVLCLITEIPYDLFEYGRWFDPTTQSVLPTLTLGYTALVVSGWWRKKTEHLKAAGTAGCIVICLAAASVSWVIKSEYKFAGVLLVVMFYLYLTKADKLDLPARGAALAGLLVTYICIYVWMRSGFGGWTEFVMQAKRFSPMIPGTICAAIPLMFYSRELGYHSRWFDALYSCFYPLQFLLLVIVRDVIF